jgi:hypothetical protein
MWPQVIKMPSTYRASNITDLLSMLRVITKYSKCSGKISATKFDIGAPIANLLNVL